MMRQFSFYLVEETDKNQLPFFECESESEDAAVFVCSDQFPTIKRHQYWIEVL